MAHTVEGNTTVGFRVVDDERGALTGRKKTAEDALAAAGLEKPKPTRAPRGKKTADES